MFAEASESFWDGLMEKAAQKVIDLLWPKLEAIMVKRYPRWMSYETAGAYIDKTRDGWLSTMQAHAEDLPVTYVGGKPRVDREDIDRLCLNLKGR